MSEFLLLPVVMAIAYAVVHQCSLAVLIVYPLLMWLAYFLASRFETGSPRKLVSFPTLGIRLNFAAIGASYGLIPLYLCFIPFMLLVPASAALNTQHLLEIFSVCGAVIGYLLPRELAAGTSKVSGLTTWRPHG